MPHLKLKIVIVLTFLLCFILNYLKSQQIVISLANGLIIFFSINIFLFGLGKNDLHNFISDWKRLIFVLILGLIPIFSYLPDYRNLVYVLLTGLVIIYLGLIIDKFKPIFLLIGFSIIFLGNLLSIGVINIDSFNGKVVLNPKGLIFHNFSSNNVVESVNWHRNYLVLPFNLSSIMFNKLIYSRYLYSNMMKAISLNTFNDIILLCNLYPLIYGVYFFYKKNLYGKKVILIWTSLVFFGTAINLSFDKYKSFYFLGPILLYLILLGLTKINLKIYLLLFLLSLFIQIYRF